MKLFSHEGHVLLHEYNQLRSSIEEKMTRPLQMEVHDRGIAREIYLHMWEDICPVTPFYDLWQNSEFNL